MRPLKLRLVAFGPYAEEQIFDFLELGENNLFLMTGNTGAGKTSMFDAMCVALFGESSAGQAGRLARDMRSDFARGDLLTEVVFDFSLGKNNHYRAFYAPEQMRRKKKGDGFVKVNASASLHSLPESGAPELLAEGVRGTKEKIEGLIGLDSSQFRQVVMLAQGQFRGLLEADSQSRERIFESLFGTRQFAQIEKRLKDQAAEVQGLHRDAQRTLTVILEGVGCDSLQNLRDEIARREAEIIELLEQEKQAEKHLISSQEALVAGEKGNQQLQEAEENLTALNELQSQKGSFDNKRQQLHDAEKAATLTPLYSEQEKRRNESELVSKRLEKSKVELERVTIECGQAEGLLKAAEKNRSSIERLKRDRQTLEGKMSKLSEYTLGKKELTHAEEQSQKARKEEEESRVDLEKKRMILNNTRQDLLKLREANQDLRAIEDAGKRIRSLIDMHQSIATLNKEINAHSLLVTNALQVVENQKDTLTKNKEGLGEILASWVDGQAARIAKGLKSGDPCPVCGSPDHPAPQYESGESVTDEQLAQQEKKVAFNEDLLEKRREESKKLQDNHNKLKTRHETIEQTIRSETEFSLDELIAQREVLKKRYQEVLQIKTDIERFEKEVKEQEQNESEQQDVVEKLQAVMHRVAGDVIKVKATVDSLERDIEEKYRDQDVLTADIGAMTLKISTFETQLDLATRKYRQEHEDLTKKSEQVTGATSELERCHRAFEAARHDYLSKLNSSLFENEERFLSAVLDEDQLLEFRASIEAYNAELLTSEERYRRSSSLAKGKIFAHLDHLQHVLGEAKVQFDSRQEIRITHQATRDGCEKERARGELEQAKIDRLDSQYKTLGKIADVANGNNNKRTSFHRFILQTLLDEVLEVASHRLKTMTNQKFYLSRDDGLRDARKQSGLDLILTDTFTGTQRSVKSLSGGEGFLAALSLALGLSDVVQSHAGGIKLDTIFIDEGFGSLSPDALDQVIDVLNGLSGEGRLVGIISHVPELKQQIGAQLQVVEGVGGSSAFFKV